MQNVGRRSRKHPRNAAHWVYAGACTGPRNSVGTQSMATEPREFGELLRRYRVAAG